MAQIPSHDVALVPWINLTLLLLWEAALGGSAAVRGSLSVGAGVALGLSILTKGLSGVAVVAVAYGGCQMLAWIRSRSLAPFGSACLRPALVLLVAVLVAGPWYAVAQSQNPKYFSYYFRDRHLLAFATGTQPHGDQPWWYYLPLLLGGGLPWIGYLSAAARGRGAEGEGRGAGSAGRGGSGHNAGATTGGKRSHRGNFKFAICDLQFAIANSALALSVPRCPPEPRGPNPEPRPPPPVPRPPPPALVLAGRLGAAPDRARSKLVTYLWPAFPPLAILAALAWAAAIEGTLGRTARRSFAGTFVFSSASGPLVLPAVLLALQIFFGLRYGWPAWAAVLIVAAAAPLPLIAWRARRVQASLTAAVLCLCAQFVVAMTLVLPPAAEIYSARVLAEHFNRLGQLPARLYLAEERVGSLVFYLDPRLRAGLKPDQIEQLRAEHSPPRPGDLVAVPDQQRHRTAGWLDLEGNPCETVGRYRLYRISHAIGTASMPANSQ